jgi:hypothetical protein
VGHSKCSTMTGRLRHVSSPHYIGLRLTAVLKQKIFNSRMIIGKLLQLQTELYSARYLEVYDFKLVFVLQARIE